MKVKVDTKEKFTVLQPTENDFTVILAEELTRIVIKTLQEPVKNIIIDFSDVKLVENQALVELATLHQLCYKNNASFVICNISNEVFSALKKLDLTDALNITPTKSEAWDMVQMEEIERELFGEEE